MILITEFFDLPEYKNLDYSRPIVGYGNFTKDIRNSIKCQVDQSIVEKKFALWDKAIEMNLFEDTGKDKKTGKIIDKERYYMYLKAVQLLKDKSIFAYSHFKLNGKPMKLRWYQDLILSDQNDMVIFAAANQIGKSITLDVDAATDFSMDHGKGFVGILVSNSRDQSEYQMDRIKELLKTAKIDYQEESTTETKTGKKDNAKIITYTFYEDDKKTPRYSNRIVCCPPTSSALGYPADKLWLDEFDFWEDIDQNWFINQVAIPRTFETNGKIRIFSNPDGKEKYLYKLWNEVDKKGNAIWNRYNFNYWDKSGVTQEQFDKKTRSMTEHQIQSTMLAVFTKSEGAFFSTDEINDGDDVELAEKSDSAGFGRDTAWFLDIGSVHDQSVLKGGYIRENQISPENPLIDVFYSHKYPVGYPLGRVFGIEIKEKDGWEDYADENPSVKEVLIRYSASDEGDAADNVDLSKLQQPLFGFDATGNSAAAPLLQTLGIDAVDVTFSGPRKWAMYQRYQYYVQNRWIHRAPDRDNNTIGSKDTKYQMSKLVIEVGTAKKSYKQVHHLSEEDFDDCPDAEAGLIHLIENPDLPSLSFDVLTKKGSVINQETGNYKPDKEVDEQFENIKKAESEGQYIPKWMKSQEMNNFIEREDRYI